jgi:hypothetical protein
MKVKPAKGQRGHLLDNFDGTYTFRIYIENFEFKDYLLRHCDLVVVIDDDDASLYEDGTTFELDHNPATLGLDE